MAVTVDSPGRGYRENNADRGTGGVLAMQPPPSVNVFLSLPLFQICNGGVASGPSAVSRGCRIRQVHQALSNVQITFWNIVWAADIGLMWSFVGRLMLTFDMSRLLCLVGALNLSLAQNPPHHQCPWPRLGA
jgi:hypothetical protein